MDVGGETNDYFARLRADTAAAAKRDRPQIRTLGEKKVEFRLDRPYENTSPVLAFRFIVALYDLYGEEIRPVKINNGCIAIDTVFASDKDCFGRDFIELTWKDNRYHELYARFDVSRMYLHGFSRVNNYTSRFKVDRLGRPAVF